MTESTDNLQRELEASVQVLSNPDKPWLFQKGQSGNPLGRHKNSKNKISLLLQNISEDDQKAIAEKLVKIAKEGHFKYYAAVLPYLVPKAKAPNTQMIGDDVDIAEIKLETQEDLKQSSELIIKNMIVGKISPSEARDMIQILEKYKNTFN